MFGFNAFAAYPYGTVQNVTGSYILLTGQQSTASNNVLAPSELITLALTGQYATGLFGTETTSQLITLTLTGQSATGLFGTETTSQLITLALTGQSVIGSKGNVGTSQLIALTGQSVIGSKGNVGTTQLITVLQTGKLISSSVGVSTSNIVKQIDAISQLTLNSGIMIPIKFGTFGRVRFDAEQAIRVEFDKHVA